MSRRPLVSVLQISQISLSLAGGSPLSTHRGPHTFTPRCSCSLTDLLKTDRQTGYEGWWCHDNPVVKRAPVALAVSLATSDLVALFYLYVIATQQQDLLPLQAFTSDREGSFQYRDSIVNI